MKAKLWSVTMDTDFDSGAGIQLVSVAPGHVSFQAPWDSSPTPLWFHFRIRGAKGWTVRFTLANASLCKGAILGGIANKRMRPVYTTDGPAAARRRWKRVDAEGIEFNSAEGSYTFSIRVTGDELFVAQSYPYNLEEWGAFTADHKKHPALKVDTIGTSEMGRAIPHATIAEPGTKKKGTIWLMSRHHAAEIGGGWALDGHLRWLMSDDAKAKWLRTHYSTRVIPFVDIDGVLEGYHGKGRAPIDFNRAWLADSPRTEIRQYQKAILSTDVCFAIDYHSPGGFGRNMTFLSHAVSTPDDLTHVSMFFAETARALSPKTCRIMRTRAPAHPGDGLGTTSRGSLFWLRGVPGATPEVSTCMIGDGGVTDLKGYRLLGAAYGKALQRTLERFGDSFQKRRWQDIDQSLRPYPEYNGEAFTGWIQWCPPRFGSLRAVQDDGEILKASLKQAGGRVHFATNRLPLQKQLKITYSMRALAKAPPTVVGKVFYYNSDALQFERRDMFELSPTEDWETLHLTLNPPPGASLFRLSFDFKGARSWLKVKAVF